MATTILLVDDSPTVRSILKVYLAGVEGGALKFVETDRGDRALQALRHMPINLVIADFAMPVMNGLAFVEAVRREVDERVRNVAIILLTGNPEADLEQRASAAGVNLFLRKPVDSPTLVGAVRRLLERSSTEPGRSGPAPAGGEPQGSSQGGSGPARGCLGLWALPRRDLGPSGEVCDAR